MYVSVTTSDLQYQYENLSEESKKNFDDFIDLKTFFNSFEDFLHHYSLEEEKHKTVSELYRLFDKEHNTLNVWQETKE